MYLLQKRWRDVLFSFMYGYEDGLMTLLGLIALADASRNSGAVSAKDDQTPSKTSQAAWRFFAGWGTYAISDTNIKLLTLPVWGFWGLGAIGIILWQTYFKLPWPFTFPFCFSILWPYSPIWGFLWFQLWQSLRTKPDGAFAGYSSNFLRLLYRGSIFFRINFL